MSAVSRLRTLTLRLTLRRLPATPRPRPPFGKGSRWGTTGRPTRSGLGTGIDLTELEFV